MNKLSHFRKLYCGRSMRRVFEDGEQIYLESVDFDQVCRGDIVVFHRKDGKWIIHRVVVKKNQYLITRGDNCANCDPDPITRKIELFRAIGVDGVNGKYRAVFNGWRGQMQYQSNQLRRIGHLAVENLVNHLLPLMWWRRVLSLPVCAGKVKYFMACDKVVAVWHNGTVEYKPAIKKLFYKLPKDWQNQQSN